MFLKNNYRIDLLTVVVACLLIFSFSATIEANSLEKVKQEGEISFAMSGAYPPFNYYNDQNELTGFDVEVAAEVAKRLGVEAKYVTTSWSGITEGLRAGRYDAILGSMAITPKRLEVVNFSIPYYYSGAQLIVRQDSNISRPEQMNNKLIGVTTGTTFEEDAKELGAEVKLYDNDNQTLLELVNGRIDGVISDRVVGLTFKKKGYDVKLAGKLLRKENIAVALRKEDDSLLVKLNMILLNMHQDGTLSELSEKWFGVDITSQ